jgi:eukaryotic-like serine/threonine-protein kinase
VKKPIPFGKYYLLDRISVGGMAEVFKAKAFGVEGFERMIAVKRILPSIAEDEEFITMFIDEAKIAVQLQHANIAQIFDLGKVGESYFIALEYVHGRDIRSIVDKMRKTKTFLPIPMAVYVTMKVCEGLDYAHNKKDPAGRELNLVHRDVSPQNILISYDGEVKIIDFGITKAAGKAGKTQAGILKGKFGYMSPEQVRGLPLDRRSDIFAVGICLWELITGERLFVGESDFSTLEKVRNVEIVPPSRYNSELSPALERIVLKTLSKEVEDRYQSAMDLHDGLQRWMYESGRFFSRKELAEYMYNTFQEEIERETRQMGDVAGLLRSSVPPPDEVSSIPSPPIPSQRSQNRSGPSIKIQTPPPVPPSVPKSGSAPVPLPSPPGGLRAPTPLDLSSPRRLGGPPPKPPGFRTPAPAYQVSKPPLPGDPTRSLSTPVSQKSDLLMSDPMAPSTVPAGATDLQMDDWDEDEPPTNIYSKEAAKEMAKASLAMKATQEVPAAFGMGDDIAVPQAMLNGRRRKRTWPAVLLGLGVASIILAAAVIFFLDKDKTGTFELYVDPPNLKSLEVVVDGTDRLPSNMSPFKKKLPPGSHTFTIRHKGFKNKVVPIRIRAGENIRRSVTLENVSTGFFIETEPPGATVFVNDRPYAEKTPVTIDDLEPGTYSVRLVKGENYQPKSLEVEVVTGEIVQLPLKKLDLKMVEVTLTSVPSGADVTLIGDNKRQKLGSAPVLAKLDTSKEYKVQFSKDGYREEEKLIEFTPGESKITVEGSLARRNPGPRPPRKPIIRTPKATGDGALSVQTRPWSKVFINGKFVKNTPLVNHALKPGSYTVTVENPDFQLRKNFRVKITSGRTTTLVKNLL